MSSGPDPALEQLGVLDTLTRKPSPILVLPCIFVRSIPTSEFDQHNEESLGFESVETLPREMLVANSNAAPKGRLFGIKSTPS
jgi:hypothetical protein